MRVIAAHHLRMEEVTKAAEGRAKERLLSQAVPLDLLVVYRACDDIGRHVIGRPRRH